MDFTAEIVSIGDEITSGAIVDTNSAWLSAQLADLGIRTLYHSTVGDEMEPMIEVFRTAVLRSNLVLISGGIGPTEDDLTRQAVAEMLQVPLLQNEEALEKVKENFCRRQRTMPESNRIQSYFPKEANIIDNPHGTAPGFEVIQDRSLWQQKGSFCLMVFPGVPVEMKEMWSATGKMKALAFYHQQSGKCHVVMNHRIHCYGLGESELEARLPHLISRSHTPTVGITVKEGIITLRIRAEGDSEAICTKQILETKETVQNILGNLIFGEEEETLPAVASALARKKKKKIAALEWGTHGLLSAKIESDVFAGGTVFASSDDFSKEMLATMFMKTQADYVLVVGPYPEDKKMDPPGKVFVGLFDRQQNKLSEELYTYGSHPAIIDSLFCYRAFNLLRLNS